MVWVEIVGKVQNLFKLHPMFTFCFAEPLLVSTQRKPLILRPFNAFLSDLYENLIDEAYYRMI
jgi:hypothetical protein